MRQLHREHLHLSFRKNSLMLFICQSRNLFISFSLFLSPCLFSQFVFSSLLPFSVFLSFFPSFFPSFFLTLCFSVVISFAAPGFIELCVLLFHEKSTISCTYFSLIVHLSILLLIATSCTLDFFENLSAPKLLFLSRNIGNSAHVRPAFVCTLGTAGAQRVLATQKQAEAEAEGEYGREREMALEPLSSGKAQPESRVVRSRLGAWWLPCCGGPQPRTSEICPCRSWQRRAMCHCRRPSPCRKCR